MSGPGSALGRARGLGAAKEGVAHWWTQRVLVVALVPLLLWLAASLALMTGADHATVTAWIARPAVAITLSVTLFVTLYHLKLGLEGVIDDYVHARFAKYASLLLVAYGTFALGAVAIFSVLKIAFQG